MEKQNMHHYEAAEALNGIPNNNVNRPEKRPVKGKTQQRMRSVGQLKHTQDFMYILRVQDFSGHELNIRQ